MSQSIQAAITKHQRPEKQQNFICHSAGGWEIPDQGASRFSSGEDLFPGS